MNQSLLLTKIKNTGEYGLSEVLFGFAHRKNSQHDFQLYFFQEDLANFKILNSWDIVTQDLIY